MRVLFVCYEKEPKVVSIPHELSELQELVGGLIEIVEPFDDSIVLVCNENGRSDGKPVNRVISDHMDICGDFFLCGYGETGLEDIPESKVFKYAAMFRLPRNGDQSTAEQEKHPWYQIMHV